MRDSEVAKLLQMSGAAQQRGDVVSAREQLYKANSASPDNPQILNALGMLALGDRDFIAASSHFTSASDLDPTSPVLLVNLATARRGAADDVGERDALFKVLDIDQGHLTANLRLAELHDRLGEKGDAMARWAAVVGIAQALPDLTPALEELIARARANLEMHSKALGAVLDEGLEGERDQLSASEKRRFDACVDAALGRRRIYQNECHGLHFPFLPADEFFDRDFFPWMTQIEAMTDVIAAEFRKLWEKPEGIRPYVAMDKGTPENKWSDLDHSLDWSAFFLWRHGVRDDDACARCPETAKAVEALPLSNIPGKSPTVFFSILRPRTHLPAHTGVTNARAIVHLPLIIPESCGFRVGGETREWRPGRAFAFDDTIDHEAWNNSDQPRAILIFDVWNPHLTDAEKRMLQRFFELSSASGYAGSDGVD